MWEVNIPKRVIKNLEKYPDMIPQFFKLFSELKQKGPYLTYRLNYSKLRDNIYHCHIKKGQPTFVAVWEIKNKKIKILEVLYAGTHERVKYGKF